MPRLSKIGAAALAAFGWTSGSSVTASYLVVAGGGGGGGGLGGGGGAGGLLASTASLNPTLSYTVTVGAGGTGAIKGVNATGTSGSNSVFGSFTSTGGGGGGTSLSGGSSPQNGLSGGSGGGGSGSANSGSGTGGAATSGQGSAGGNGIGTGDFGGGGGGGAGAVGATGKSTGTGAGGIGLTSSISGTSTYYAGGGGGGCDISGGAGGLGGGGAAGTRPPDATTGTAGTANLGGGGGAGSGGGPNGGNGANGGSGVVIISYPGAQQFGGGNVTSSGGNTIHTFTTSGTLSPLSSLTAQYLIVAGGGGGGSAWTGGGGGAGGMLTGTGVTIDTNSNYVVAVGAGGSAATNGSNSSWSMVSTAAVGGGFGVTDNSSSPGGNGGSGGGNGYNVTTAGGSGTSGQGNNGGGGSGWDGGAGTVAGGGGGGKSAVGANAAFNSGGAGGAGAASSISGSSVTYAGGGGGGSGGGSAGAGGAGGGGAGALGSNASGTAGTANTGGGGGGAAKTSGTGGTGGSGVVIIAYPGSTQQMAGGTVTISGGNVIHTFTSSGYLTPIKYASRSLRFRSSATAYLNRTFNTPTNNKIFTYSTWVKIGSGTTGYPALLCCPSTGDELIFNLTGGNGTIEYYNNSAISSNIKTNAIYRDPAAWYHIMVATDTTQATASNRVKLYVNGVQVTSFNTATYPAQNYSQGFNSAVSQQIGKASGVQYFDGYMTEVNFVDGAALTPSSFGTFNSFGVWQPITYGGSYGTNGFYLTFGNNASTTTLGYDTSPQGNNWTTNNISVTAGVTYDSMLDVPTLTSATVANYCVANPLQNAATLSNGNLTINGVSASWTAVAGTIGVSSGKYYWELNIGTINNSGAYCAIGVAISSASLTQTYASPTTAWVYDGRGTKQGNGAGDAGASTVTYGATYVSGDVIGVALDMDAGTLTFYKNNTSQGVAFNTGLSGLTIFPWIGIYGSSANMAVNFGQRPFTYTPPSGFVALNTYNLSTPTIANGAAYMAASLYTGTGSALSVSNAVNGTSFQPDWVWIKGRNATYNHGLFDVNRGVRNVLSSNSTNAEILETAGTSMTAFDSGGFSLGTNGSSVSTNVNGSTFVAWQWKANGTGVSNTSGSITSTVSANTTAGFSIATFSGASGGTVGHGLGVAPQMIIIKSSTTATGWYVYTSTIGPNGWLVLETTAAAVTGNSAAFGGTPTSTVWTYGAGLAGTGNYVAYAFTPIAGFSAFGSYTGNGSTDGPFVYTGFRPRFVLVKNSSAAGKWVMMDTSRGLYNEMTGTNALYPNTNETEGTDSANRQMDFLSNGFKLRCTGGDANGSGNTIIYMAFAENPFKYSNAR